MSSKDWLLNAAAIKVARQCIKLVDEELGVRLTLSHPDFLELLEEYSLLSDSSRLVVAVRELSSYSSRERVVSAVNDKKNVIAINERSGFKAFESSDIRKPTKASSNPDLASVKNLNSAAAVRSHLTEGSGSPSAPKDRRVQFPDQRNDVVFYHGKNYRRWSEGKEFKGLYRGRPRYA